MAQMANMGRVQKGSFVGNGTGIMNIACPFKPDYVFVWSDSLKTNPAITSGGLVSCCMVREFGYNTSRWTNATASSPAMGGAVQAPVMNYSNGIYQFGTQSATASFALLEGYSYNYVLATA